MERRNLQCLIFLAVILVACGGESSDEVAAARTPPQYEGAIEMERGEFFTTDLGHRVTVHQVEHRVSGTEGGRELTGFAAEVEFCAGETPATVSSSFQLFTENVAEWMGEMEILHGINGTASVGLKEPLLSPNIEAGDCSRGWVDFLNVYGDHGEPAKLGFRETSDVADVVWPVSEN